jgi:hypothetical protein
MTRRMTRRLPTRTRTQTLTAVLTASLTIGIAVRAPQQATVTLPPSIALAQPAQGATVAQDKPVIVFRFAAPDPGDPIDASSFTALVDGVDRSAHFKVAPTEAWGPLVVASDGARTREALGAHQVAARICTLRGACGNVSAVVTVVPPLARDRGDRGATARARIPIQSPCGKRRSLVDPLLAAAHKLLAPYAHAAKLKPHAHAER